MKILTREEFHNPTDLKTKEVPTPELGEDTGVILRSLGANDRMKLLTKFGEGVKLTGEKGLQFIGKLLAGMLIGPDGELLCIDEADVLRVTDHDLELVKRLGEEAMTLTGIGVDEDDDDVDPEDGEAVREAAVKNSGSGD